MHRLFVLALLACGATAAAPKQPTSKPERTRNPCFEASPPIAAADLWKALEKYSWSVYQSAEEKPPPPTMYGSCKVDRNKVTTTAGTLVAELGCGVRVLVPGIRDSLGIELGTATGKDVLERRPKPTTPLTCLANGHDQARCHFDRAENADTDSDWYVVAGQVGDEPLTGDAATKFFSDKRLVELDVSIWCH